MSGLYGRALAAWFLLIAIEMVHGIARAMFLVPVVGDFRSRQIGVFTGTLLILGVAYLLAPWLRPPDAGATFRIGALWLGLTLAFEFGFGHYVFGRSWTSLAEDYDLLHGGLLPLGLLMEALAPWIVWRIRR